MASNKDLCADIVTLCAERGVAVPDGLDQLKNPKLLEILEGLRQQGAAGGGSVLPGGVVETAVRPLVAPSPPDGADSTESADKASSGDPPIVTASVVSSVSTATPAPASQKATTGAQGYYVAEGKTVMGRSGDALGAFQQVTPRDLSGGQEELEHFHAAGYLFKR